MAKRRRSKKWISWLILLILVVAVVVVCVLVWNSYFKPKDDGQANSTEQSSVDEKKEEKKSEDNKSEEKKEDSDEPEEKKVEQYDGKDPNKAAELTGVITYAGVSGDNLMIRVNIDQYLNGGTCSLVLRQGGGNVYNATASIIDSASTSTCEGFNVPVAGLSAGVYNIIIYIDSGGKTGEISGEVTL